MIPWQLVEPNGKSGDAYSSSSDWSSTHGISVRQLVHLQLDGSYTLSHPMVALVLFAKDGGQVLPSGIRGVNRLRSHRVKKDVCRIGSEDGVESLKLGNPDFGNISLAPLQLVIELL